MLEDIDMRKGVITLVGLICLFVLTGCKTKYVTVPEYHTVYKTHIDTLEKIDSVVKEKETIIKEADSATVAELGIQLKNNERAILILRRELEKQLSKESEHITDTVIKTDSVRVPYPVEKQLTKWEQTKMQVGGITLVICILLILSIIVGWIIKAKKKI